MAYKKWGKGTNGGETAEERYIFWFVVNNSMRSPIKHKGFSSLVVWLLRRRRPRPDASLTRCFSFFITQRQSPSSLLLSEKTKNEKR